MANVKILAFSGSARTQSYNKKLIRVAAHAAQTAGAEVTLIDLREYPMPIYDGDLEEKDGLPFNARALKKLFLSHDALLFSSPEYNSSFSPLLKNVIDWVSRPDGENDETDPFENKVAAIISASPGALGGLRGLIHLRAVLGNIGILVLPGQVAIGKAHEAFDEQGDLKNPKQLASIQALVKKLVHIAQAIQAP